MLKSLQNLGIFPTAENTHLLNSNWLFFQVVLQVSIPVLVLFPVWLQVQEMEVPAEAPVEVLQPEDPDHGSMKMLNFLLLKLLFLVLLVLEKHLLLW